MLPQPDDWVAFMAMMEAEECPASPDRAAFLRATATVVSALDAAVPPGGVASSPPVVAAIVRLCACAHGEWIRVHPFANGSGRTARVWANWIAVRYGLPPFVWIKPRPDDLLFAGAAEMLMRSEARRVRPDDAASLFPNMHGG